MTDRALLERVERVDATFRRAAEAYAPALRMIQEGRVRSVRDGVAEIAGLPDVGFEEVVRIDGRTRALVLGLERDHLHAVLLDELTARRGGRARGTGRGPEIPVGAGLLGRVVDPLGRPLDGLPAPDVRQHAPLERPAPLIHRRGAVHAPLLTGILAVDAMLPIGRGQRELILGDEGTGKTTLALDALLRQAETDVVGVYVAVGRRRTEIWRAAELLRSGGGRWVVVAAPDDRSPGLRYLAPYAGCAVAEHFMDRGAHALVVYDDLTSHAVAWRELSLLMRRPPGREAFPGDVFYLHSRLLERATQLSTEEGGGSLTALPLATLEGGRLSAYLPTNLISITDGQIVLSQELFAAGERPAIDAGLSVSRVGGKAQPQAFRELAGRLRLEYAAFLELEVFSRIGSRLETSVARRLAHGRRLRALLRQPKHAPLDVFGETVRLALSAEPELLGALPVAEVPRIVAQLEEGLREREPALAARLEREPTLHRDDAVRLREGLAARLREGGWLDA
jgi:F-type H+-transporting ATPase subunit alpha